MQGNSVLGSLIFRHSGIAAVQVEEGMKARGFRCTRLFKRLAGPRQIGDRGFKVRTDVGINCAERPFDTLKGSGSLQPDTLNPKSRVWQC